MGRIVLPVRCIHLSPQNLQMRYTLQGRINATSQATLRMGDHPVWSVGGPDVVSEVLGSGEGGSRKNTSIGGKTGYGTLLLLNGEEGTSSPKTAVHEN